MHGRSGGGFPQRFHGGQFGRLDLGHMTGMQIALDNNKHGSDQAAYQSHFKRARGKFHMLFFEKMIGADAHHKKGA